MDLQEATPRSCLQVAQDVLLGHMRRVADADGSGPAPAKTTRTFGSSVGVERTGTRKGVTGGRAAPGTNENVKNQEEKRRARFSPPNSHDTHANAAIL
jgi:hypothetical protein